MLDGFTRRNFLAGLSSIGQAAAQQAKKPREIPRVGEFVRYVDPVTENSLVRITSLSSANRLPRPQNAFISVRNRFLVFSSDRSGLFAPYLVDLRNGLVRQVAEASALDPLSLSLEDGDRSVFFLDGGTLKQAQISGRRSTTVAEGVSAFAGRSQPAMLVVRESNLQTLSGETVAMDVAGPCQISPNGAFCLFTNSASPECEFWCVPLRPRGNPRRLAAGRVRSPFWSPDGESVLFLRDVDGNGVTLAEIHRVSVDGGSEEKVALTSQFAAFAPNGNATVFVGASRSKAQPTVDLLLRASKRELTLCEHHASKPDTVSPVFAPDSRRVYFQSDREGKPALYSINVELLVEPTLS